MSRVRYKLVLVLMFGNGGCREDRVINEFFVNNNCYIVDLAANESVVIS